MSKNIRCKGVFDQARCGVIEDKMGIMGTYGGFRLASEHKELVTDITNVIISYTPLSGVRDTIKFGQKWLRAKRGPQRVAMYIQESDRRSFIKSRGRRLRPWTGSAARV